MLLNPSAEIYCPLKKYELENCIFEEYAIAWSYTVYILVDLKCASYGVFL